MHAIDIARRPPRWIIGVLAGVALARCGYPPSDTCGVYPAHDGAPIADPAWRELIDWAVTDLGSGVPEWDHSTVCVGVARVASVSIRTDLTAGDGFSEGGHDLLGLTTPLGDGSVHIDVSGARVYVLAHELAHTILAPGFDPHHTDWDGRGISAAIYQFGSDTATDPITSDALRTIEGGQK